MCRGLAERCCEMRRRGVGGGGRGGGCRHRKGLDDDDDFGIRFQELTAPQGGSFSLLEGLDDFERGQGPG